MILCYSAKLQYARITLIFILLTIAKRLFYLKIMKKSVLTLMLMLVSVLALNAQSLTGKEWFTKLSPDDGGEVFVTLTFEKNGSCEMLVATDYQIKQDGVPISVAGGVTVPGTYTLNGKDLKMNLNRSKAVVEFDYDVKGMDAKTKAIMDKTMKPEFDGMKKEFKDMMLNGMPKMQNMKVVTLESKKLVIKDDDGDEIPFFAD